MFFDGDGGGTLEVGPEAGELVALRGREGHGGDDGLSLFFALALRARFVVSRGLLLLRFGRGVWVLRCGVVVFSFGVDFGVLCEEGFQVVRAQESGFPRLFKAEDAVVLCGAGRRACLGACGVRGEGDAADDADAGLERLRWAGH